MASQLDSVILYPDAVQQFEDCILPMIQEDEKNLGHVDIPARSEAWNNWTDAMCKDGQISDWQYENWSQPDSCGG